MSLMLRNAGERSAIEILQREVQSEILRRRERNGVTRLNIEAIFHSELSRATEDFGRAQAHRRVANANG